jgi:histidinol-phosphatase (PHP family)
MSHESTRAYQRECARLREVYGDRIRILCGIEQDQLGTEPTSCYDYVIGATHYVTKDGFFLDTDDYIEKTIENCERFYDGDFLAYAEDFYAQTALEFDRTRCDIVGHFDLIAKFNEGNRLFDESDPRYVKAASDCARSLARQGVMFEINTGAVAKGYRTAPYPGEAMLRRACEAGGRVILTSDCHDMAFLDCHFAESAALAKACGFRTAWEYRGNQLIEYPL